MAQTGESAEPASRRQSTATAGADASGDAVEGDASAEVAPAEKQKKRKESNELVEYSPDELRAVDKEMLNAEITQLEGKLLSFPGWEVC